MEPRIVVPDDDDRATIVAALVQYTHGVSARAMLNGDVTHMITELKITVGLLEVLCEQAIAEQAERIFGPVPSDEDIKEAFEKFRKTHGKDPEV
jgi:hypothetical protein